MTFLPEKTDEFLSVFEHSKHRIRAMAGCRHLELLRDHDNPNVFMTYSYWDSAEALEAYRVSALFRDTWARTKVLFESKPVAFSSYRIDSL